MRVYNFSSGPAKLPEEVLRQAGEEMLSWHGKGYSIMETSHRSPEFTAIIEETEQLLRSLLGIPADYSVLLLQGGAHLQFAMVPLNLLGPKTNADYVVTGIWSEKAAEEGRRFCNVNVVADNAADDRTVVPGPGGAEVRSRPPRSCTTAPTRPSTAWSSRTSPRPVACRWWPTCRRTSCRVRSTSRVSA